MTLSLEPRLSSYIRMQELLLGLQRLHLLPVPPENFRHVPALQTGVGVYLGTVVHLMLQRHHQDSPTTQGALGVYQGHLAIEPLKGSPMDASAKLLGRRFKRWRPTGLAISHGRRPIVDPALAAVCFGLSQQAGYCPWHKRLNKIAGCPSAQGWAKSP